MNHKHINRRHDFDLQHVTDSDGSYEASMMVACLTLTLILLRGLAQLLRGQVGLLSTAFFSCNKT